MTEKECVQLLSDATTKQVEHFATIEKELGGFYHDLSKAGAYSWALSGIGLKAEKITSTKNDLSAALGAIRVFQDKAKTLNSNLPFPEFVTSAREVLKELSSTLKKIAAPLSASVELRKGMLGAGAVEQIKKLHDARDAALGSASSIGTAGESLELLLSAEKPDLNRIGDKVKELIGHEKQFVLQSAVLSDVLAEGGSTATGITAYALQSIQTKLSDRFRAFAKSLRLFATTLPTF